MAQAQSRLTQTARPDLPEVACLEEFWASHAQGAMPLQEMVGKVLLDTLGLGNQQVYEFLYGEHPSYDRFCEWIVETAGPPDPALLSRYHGWLMECAPNKAARQQLAAIAAMEPVLDAEAMAFWDAQGYVVVPDAIAPEEVSALREHVWETVGASPDDRASWYRAKTNGIMVPDFQHPTIEAARRSPRIHKAFAQLWGTENLWVTIDRMGFNPPETDEWPFAGSGIHWDVSLAQPIPFGTQVVLYLTDTAADQGAFRCVPGFHRRIDAWLDGLGDADPRKVDLSDEQHMVAGKAGDLIIWRQDLPHAASPNRSDRPRLVQYLNYYSPDMPIRSRWR